MSLNKVVEVINWTFTDDELPDEGITVLLFAPDFDGDKVWLGWLDEGDWRSICGGKLDCEVVAWADVPSGPPAINEVEE